MYGEDRPIWDSKANACPGLTALQTNPTPQAPQQAALHVQGTCSLKGPTELPPLTVLHLTVPGLRAQRNKCLDLL